MKSYKLNRGIGYSYINNLKPVPESQVLYHSDMLKMLNMTPQEYDSFVNNIKNIK